MSCRSPRVVFTLQCSVLLFVTHLLLVQVVAACWCNSTDGWRALEALYHSTNGRNWTRRDKWLERGSTVCEWYGIVGDCGEIALGRNNLVGTLPVELALLNRSLRRLNVSGNSIIGSLPAQHSALSLMLVYVAHDNSIDGTLPAEYAAWTVLQSFAVRDNAISGTLPPQYALWTNIVRFSFQNNRLSGTLPPEYAAMTLLQSFSFRQNRITGTLPPEYKQWVHLIEFFAYSNLLCGSLPSEYQSWEQLREFHVHHNFLNGTLPKEYASMKSLRWFAVHNNTIGGTLPPEYSEWTDVSIVSLHTNVLSGSLPEAYAAWTNIHDFDADRNSISGTLPPQIASWHRMLERFSVTQNVFSGSLPVEFQLWQQLFRFQCDHNNFTGGLPKEYSAWQRLQIFIADGNPLGGELPIEYSAWSQLEVFSVAGAAIRGSIPASYSAWTEAHTVQFSRNRLSGSIPKALGLLSLQVLALDNNYLSGSVPRLSALYVLALHNNTQLSGTIPLDMGPTLAVSVCNTRICGAVPVAWRLIRTVAVCQEASLTLAENVAHLPLSLPSCTGPPGVDSLNATINVHLKTNSEAARQALWALGAATASTSALQLSLRSAAIGRRIAACGGNGTNNAVGVPEDVGALVLDNPMRLSLPGPLSLTTGTVVGNIVLMLGVPAIACAAKLAWEALASRGPNVGAPDAVAAAMLWVWGVVQVPTEAAAVVLVLDGAANSSFQSAAIGVAGLAVGACSVAVAVRGFLHSRRLGGQVLPLSHARRKRFNVSTCVAACRLFLTRKRSQWHHTTCRSARPTRSGSSRCAARLAEALDCVVRQQLDAVLYPRGWVLVCDAAAVWAAAALLGVASSAQVSCTGSAAAMWAVLCIATVQVLVAAVVRPRAVAADCVFDVGMCLWTAAAVLLAALGAGDEGVESSTAQAVVSAAWSVPTAGGRWLMRNRSNSPQTTRRSTVSSTREKHREQLAQCLTNTSEFVVSGRRLERGTSSSVVALSKLITSICSSADNRRAV